MKSDGDIGTVTVAGKLSADVIAGGSIRAVTAASMDPDITAQGRIDLVRTTAGDLEANVFGAQGVTRVESAGDIRGRVKSGRGIGVVQAVGVLDSDVIANGHIRAVSAASMNRRILALAGKIHEARTTVGDLQ